MEEVVIGTATALYSHLWLGLVLGILTLILYIVTRSTRGGGNM